MIYGCDCGIWSCGYCRPHLEDLQSRKEARVKKKLKKFSDNKGKMPFGKHKGVDISVVPIRYLMWAVNIVKTKSLRDAIYAEIERRGPAHRYAYGGGDFRDVDVWGDYDPDTLSGTFLDDDFDPFDPF